MREYTLIIVDDHKPTIDELDRAISSHANINIHTFQDARDALSFSEENSIHIALIDIRMPGIGGMELLRRLKEKFPHLMAIMMTGFSPEDTPVESKNLGAVDFLEKPITLPYLLATIKHSLKELDLWNDLEETKNLLQWTIDAVPDGIALCNNKGEIILSNPPGKIVKTFLEKGFRDDKIIHQNGRQYDYRVLNLSDLTLHYLRDVTGLIESERYNSFREMAKAIGHEIKNPLTPIRLLIQEVLEREVSDPEREGILQDALNKILLQVERLSSLAKTFSIYGTIREVNMRRGFLSGVLKNQVSIWTPSAKKAGIEIITEFPDREKECYFDETLLTQVLTNLIKNSIEAMERGGELDISMSLIHGKAILEIKDTGGGLPEEVEKRLFYPHMSTKTGGSGLGLLICKECIDKMRGSLEIISEDKGVKAKIILSCKTAT